MKYHQILLKIILAIVCLQNVGCQSDPTSKKEIAVNPPAPALLNAPSSQDENQIYKTETVFEKPTFPKNRAENLKRLKQKIKDQEPLVIHVFVPLCDNENQGIVPVSRSLGDGLNLSTNLYWGALYGVKTHFKRQKDWKLLFSKKDLDKDVLERVVFLKKYPNGALVYLVADAYRGDRMKACLNNYFDALTNVSKSDFSFPTQSTGQPDVKIGVEGNADLIVFNGHNGLMDTTIESLKKSHPVSRDAITVACASFDYFEAYFKKANAFPLLNTTNLLAPEAYVLEEVFDAWAMLKDEEAIHHAAGSAYHKYQKCGLRGAKRLFKSGW